MFNVCYQCGSYHADKVIDPAGPFAVCPDCGFQHPFQRMPLLVVGGASGTGKSTVCQRLMGSFTRAVILESDILWRPEFDKPETDYQVFFGTWLRLCKNIGQSGRPVVLLGAGFSVPSNLEGLVERRYFSKIHYLALVCSPEAIEDRLSRRPQWRDAGGRGFIENHLRFNRWLQEYRDQPAIQLLDTSSYTPDESASQIAAWITGRLEAFDKKERMT